MGRSRADVVMVLPQRIVGLEIKSNADTYDRLERQSKITTSSVTLIIL